MTSAILNRQSELVSRFAKHANWDDRYKLMIEMGKEMPALSESLKIEKNIVKGCQSQVWLHAELKDDGKIYLVGDSDALIVKGLVAVVLFLYSGSTPDEVLQTPPTFLKDLGFESNLSPSRANGLHAMLKQIQLYAMAFKMLKQTQGLKNS